MSDDVIVLGQEKHAKKIEAATFVRWLCTTNMSDHFYKSKLV